MTRVMEQLAADGQLLEKVYGKQKIYVVNQVHSTSPQSHSLSSCGTSSCSVIACTLANSYLYSLCKMSVTEMFY